MSVKMFLKCVSLKLQNLRNVTLFLKKFWVFRFLGRFFLVTILTWHNTITLLYLADTDKTKGCPLNGVLFHLLTN